MATVVTGFKDERFEGIGEGFAQGFAGGRAKREKDRQLQELEALFSDPDATPQQVSSAVMSMGGKPADALKFGQDKKASLQKTVDQNAIQDLTDALSGGAAPQEAFISTANTYPGMSPNLFGTLSSSPLAQQQTESTDVFDPSGNKATIKLPKGLQGEARLAATSAHSINKGGGAFSLVDPSKRLDIEQKQAGRREARAGKVDKQEETAAVLTDLGLENTPLHRGRALRYQRQRTQLETSIDTAFGKPPEQSFTQWKAPQTVMQGAITAKAIAKELTIAGGEKNVLGKAAAQAKEEVANGAFLDRIGFNTAVAEPVAMMKKLKGLQFTKDEVLAIMTKRAEEDGVDLKDIQELLAADLDILFPEEAL